MSSSTNLLQSSKYKCFWDFLHVQTGAQIIAVLALFNCCMTFADTFIQPDKCSSLILQYVNIFLEAFFFGQLLLGIRQSDDEKLVLSLIYSASWVVYFGSLDLICLIAANSKSSLGRLARTFLETFYVNKVTDDLLLAGIVYLTVKTFIALFIFDMLYRCFKYVNEKSCQEKCTQIETKVLQTSFPGTKESSTA